VFSKAAKVDDLTEVWYDGLNCDEHKHLKKIFDKGQSLKNSNFYHPLNVWRIQRS
jgi:hypothetical protein